MQDENADIIADSKAGTKEIPKPEAKHFRV